MMQDKVRIFFMIFGVVSGKILLGFFNVGRDALVVNLNEPILVLLWYKIPSITSEQHQRPYLPSRL